MAVEPRAEEPAQGARGPGPRGVRQARQPGLVPRLVRKQQDGAHAGERHDSVPDGTRCRQRVEDVRQQDHVEPAPPADELESGEAVSLAPPVQGPRGHGKPGAVERQVPFGQRYHLGPVRQQHAPSQREGRDDARQAAAAPQLQEAPAAEQLARERARAPRPRARREPVCQHHAPVPQVAPRRHVARRQLLPELHEQLVGLGDRHVHLVGDAGDEGEHSVPEAGHRREISAAQHHGNGQPRRSCIPSAGHAGPRLERGIVSQQRRRGEGEGKGKGTRRSAGHGPQGRGRTSLP
ncbi:unnamed protein product [Prorocentrum cordatum]|uniref:Uncharacterized protein n=1 Tax=Prorocentrum cordatum TaxID=2364126 RepID=A0ABN9TAN7_9DINO|nr:unnamed protein product [Polarella glacialis]